MRRPLILFALAAIAVGVLVGCSSVDDKPAMIVTDKDGVVEPRVTTVGYVNERMARVPANMLPETGGDEGKREFMEDIIRKEILVIYGIKLGVLEDERLPGALEHFEDTKAEEMLREEVIVGPAQVSPQEVEDYYAVREDLFQLQEIIVSTEEEAMEVYRRVTEGEEDFGRVAMEVSRGSTAQDGGRMQVTQWMSLHPLVREAVWNLDKDDITEPFMVGYSWDVYKVVSRKDPPEMKPLEGAHLQGISVEAKNFRKTLLEYYIFTEWDERANITYNDDAMDLAGTRIDEAAVRDQEERGEPETIDDRIAAQLARYVPEFTEEEGAMLFASYNIMGDPREITLADLVVLIENAQKGTTPKNGKRINIEGFIKKHVQEETIQAEIADRGYRDTPEMAEYLDTRTEEFIIDITYDREVVQNVEEPTGQEIRDFYRSRLDKYVEPMGIDVQMLIVATEGQANRIKQRLDAGETTFTEMVKTHSIESWSKAKDGIVQKYRVGEDRLSFLQDVAFDLEIGEVSDPVRAPGGYALVKVLASYPERQMAFSEVSSVVEQSVIGTKREALLTALLDRAREGVEVDFVEENFQYITEPADALKEKTGGSQTVTK
jgi:parvulin-like peptidyl-prolyl isomerase